METPQHSKLLHSLQNWNAKALARRQENKALKKRIAELIQSRDAWKVKAHTYQQALSDLQAQCSPEKKRSRPVQSSYPDHPNPGRDETSHLSQLSGGIRL
jgi:uncharacterized coiled-coil DUF342 family protein